ncbi:MAG: transcriptional regulator [Acidobacteria bacterium]|nr:transcriptional regulator [Acidobacteriota bacterium]
MAKSSALKQSQQRKQESKHESGRGPQDIRSGKPKIAAPETLDRLIHERLRLGIVSALAANESLTFNDLKNLMHITDGNLSVHARKLEDAGYISCNKFFEGRVPRTEYKLTSPGRRALEGYLNHMESLIKQMRGR